MNVVMSCKIEMEICNTLKQPNYIQIQLHGTFVLFTALYMYTNTNPVEHIYVIQICFKHQLNK